MILYIDTLALLFRAYHAIPDLAAEDGTPTGALYGLTNSLFRIIAETEPDHVIACFDRPEETLRQQSSESYKANRDLPEEAMIVQITLAREVLVSYGVHVVEKAGYEADDLLGTLATKDAEREEDVVIVTCDGDLLQLTVNPRIRVYFLRKGMSDFVLYDEAEVEKKNGYPAARIIDYKGLAGDSSDNIPGVPGIGDTYAKRLIAAFGGLDEIYAALDNEVLADSGFTSRVISLLFEGRESAFESRDLATIHCDAPVSLPHVRAQRWRDRIMLEEARATLEKYSFSSLVSRLNSIVGVKDVSEPISVVSDADPVLVKKAAVALWVLDASRTNASLEDVCEYAGTDDVAAAFVRIENDLEKEGRLSVWETIEEPLIPVIEKMERTGIFLDCDAASVLSKTYHRKIASLSKEIFALTGREFNLNSPKQLGEVLYGDLGLKSSSKTASGAKTTKESVLQSMADEHPIIPLVLAYRHYEKLRSTYVDALPGFLDEDGRIHTHFQQNGTITGRLSSREPNLQNIPLSGEDGTAVRNLFRAADGWEMVSIDYSQMELRLAAILSQDKALIDIFVSDGDVHRSVASRVFGVSEDAVSKEQRYAAKTINFGILYGMGAQSLRKSLSVSQSEAQSFLDEYKRAFPVLFDYRDGVVAEARSSGFVSTAFGRVRPIPGITSSLSFVRARAEREAFNTVVQGTEADIIKLAMVQIDRLLDPDAARLLLQIHDELLLEVRPSAVDSVITSVSSTMEGVYPPGGKPVPLLTEMRHGDAWGSLV